MNSLFYSNNSAFQLTQTIQYPKLSSISCAQQAVLNYYSLNEFLISQKLLTNQLLLSNSLQTRKEWSQNSSSIKVSRVSQGSENEYMGSPSKKQLQNNLEDYQDQNLGSQKIKANSNQELSRLRRRRRRIKYQLEQSNSNERIMHNKCSQTKNVIKNFVNCILNFVIRQIDKYMAILKELQISKAIIIEELNNLLGKISSIKDLRMLISSHKYCKFIRIVCEQYLKKRYFSHIFNSRVLNHKNHLKYRRKILNSLKNPATFNNLKDF